MMMAGVGMLMNLFFVGLIVAAVLKLFQIHTTLTEIKEKLASPSLASYSTPQYTALAPAPRAAPEPAARPAFKMPELRTSAPSAPAQPPAPMPSLVGDTRSGEEMLRELDSQMRMEEAAPPKPRLF